jgi:hypothetical protein
MYRVRVLCENTGALDYGVRLKARRHKGITTYSAVDLARL